MADTPYEYLPLEGRNWIRILQLYTSRSISAPLRCGIIHVNRRRVSKLKEGNVFHYSAVSYVWGEEPLFSRRIILEKVQKSHKATRAFLPITPAVDAMLRRFRNPTKTVNLWIDAVCLNQADRAEIGQQIPLMGEIFREAQNVSIWVGPENDGVVELFDFFKRHKSQGIRWTDPRLAAAAHVHWPLENLTRFLYRPWFTRRWVLQELILSKEADVYAYDQEISYSELWDIFREIKYLISLHEGHNDDVGGFVLDAHAKRVLDVFHDFRQTRHTLLHNLWLYHDLQCSDPRDRIFAIIGISTDDIEWNSHGAHIGNWSLDYRKGYKDLYRDVAAYLVAHGNMGLVFEHAVAFGTLGDTCADEPSWCPDWSKRRTTEIPESGDDPKARLWAPSALNKRPNSGHAEMLSFDKDRKQLFTRQKAAKVIGFIPYSEPDLGPMRRKSLEQNILTLLLKIRLRPKTAIHFMAVGLCELVLCNHPKMDLEDAGDRYTAEMQLKLDVECWLTQLYGGTLGSTVFDSVARLMDHLTEKLQTRKLFIVRTVEVTGPMEMEVPGAIRKILYGLGLSTQNIKVGDLILLGDPQLGASRGPAKPQVMMRLLLRKVMPSVQKSITTPRPIEEKLGRSMTADKTSTRWTAHEKASSAPSEIPVVRIDRVQPAPTGVTLHASGELFETASAWASMSDTESENASEWRLTTSSLGKEESLNLGKDHSRDSLLHQESADITEANGSSDVVNEAIVPLSQIEEDSTIGTDEESSGVVTKHLKLTWASIAASGTSPKHESSLSRAGAEKRKKSSQEVAEPNAFSLVVTPPDNRSNKANDSSIALGKEHKLSWAAIVAGIRPAPEKPVPEENSLDRTSQLSPSTQKTRSWASIVGSTSEAKSDTAGIAQLPGHADRSERKSETGNTANTSKTVKLVNTLLNEHRRSSIKEKSHPGKGSTWTQVKRPHLKSSYSKSSPKGASISIGSQIGRKQPTMSKSSDNRCKQKASSAVLQSLLDETWNTIHDAEYRALVTPSEEQELSMAEQGWNWQPQRAVACQLSGVVDLVTFCTSRIMTPLERAEDKRLKMEEHEYYDVVII
jgi:hypothetical protein